MLQLQPDVCTELLSLHDCMGPWQGQDLPAVCTASLICSKCFIQKFFVLCKN